MFEAESYYKLAGEVYKLFDTTHKRRFDWISSDFFDNNLKEQLTSDAVNLMEILNLGKDWTPAKDRQLNALFEVCTKKHPKEKILIFTQFADTAYYLFNELNNRKVDSIACVTGDSDDPTEYAYRFSPVSNEKENIKGTDKEIRVLITTDVLSEGQNLQDCHIVLNYDLPWAIIRLVQRAGRVDRIGQKSDEILCYSFLPEDGIENIIRLRQRLGQRIEENAEVVGSDETFFEGDPINIADLYNEKAGILDDEDDSEVDLASYAYQIWKNALDMNPSLQKVIPDLPNVVYSTKALNISDNEPESVIVYTKTYDDNDVLALVGSNGELLSQSQYTILKKAECNPEEKPLMRLSNHHKLVSDGLDQINISESRIGGQLGKKSSARYRVYMRLDRYYNENKDTLFANDVLKRTIEDIYRYPLKEHAKETFNRQLKAGIDDTDLAALVVSLREDDKLCVVSEDEIKYKEPQIICTMGLKYES